jgi:hypothetical protein
VDEFHLAVILVVPPLSRAALQAANDYVDRSLGVLEQAIGVAYLWRGRQVALLPTIHRRVVVTSLVVTTIIVLTATSIVAAVVVVPT